MSTAQQLTAAGAADTPSSVLGVAGAEAAAVLGDKRALSPEKKPGYKRMKSTVSMNSEEGAEDEEKEDKKVFEEPAWD